MAEERDDEQSRKPGQQQRPADHRPAKPAEELGQQSGSPGSQQTMSNQGSEDSFDDQSSGGQSGGGRPIGGNDSNTGSGTTPARAPTSAVRARADRLEAAAVATR